MIDLKKYTDKELVALQNDIATEISDRKKARYDMLVNDVKTTVKALSTEFPWEMAFALDDEYYEDDAITWNTLENLLNQ